ncbi:magnesium transporter [Paenibacillus tarimensis]
MAAELTGFLEQDQMSKFNLLIEELQPYDIASSYWLLTEEIKPKFLAALDLITLTNLIAELDSAEQYEAFRLIGPKRTTEVMDKMDNDDLAGFLDSLTDEEKQHFLATMNRLESTAVQQLMNYPPETAGRIMNNRYVWIPQHYNVKEAIAKVREFAEISDSISYLYIIDDEKKLIGVVSYRDLILAQPEDKIYDIMHARVISVTVDMDQEKVADVIRNYDFLAVPVVDRSNRLSGIITVDDIIDVVVNEANEDIQKLSGGGKNIDFDTKPGVAAMRRLPWLVLLLFIGLISGTIISRFEDTLSKIVALAFFMPMIAGMTGNTGTQSLAVVVRGLISNELKGKDILRLLRRELIVGLIIGVTCGILVTGITFVWQHDLMLGFVVGTSLLLTLIIGTIAGTIVPLILSKLKVDPAVASGPLITTLNDVLSLFTYFGIASLFLSYLD